MPIYLRSQQPADVFPKYMTLVLKGFKGGFIIAVTGGKGRKIGTGKSYTALRMAEIIQPGFQAVDEDGTQRICYTGSQVLKALTEIEKKQLRYQVVILDESEITISNRAWADRLNRLIADNAATFRDLRCVLIVVSPVMAWLDNRVRSLIAFKVVTWLTLSDHGVQGYCKIYQLLTDIDGTKIYYKRIKYHNMRTRMVCIADRFRVSLAGEKLRQDYTKLSTDFKRSLRLGSYEELQAIEAKEMKATKETFTNLFEELKNDAQVKARFIEKGKVSAAFLRLFLAKKGISQTGSSTASQFSVLLNEAFSDALPSKRS